MTITTINIGGVNYTSYASVVEADAYLAVDPTRSAAWAALNPDQKGTNLVAATRRLDLLQWSGEKVDPNQETQWPRNNATCDGESVPNTGVPKPVENATGLLAGSITRDASASNQGTSGSNIKKAKAGSADVTFFRPTNGVALQDTTAYSLVQCYLDGAGGAYGLVSGNCDNSEFLDKEAPGLNRGYP